MLLGHGWFLCTVLVGFLCTVLGGFCVRYWLGFCVRYWVGFVHGIGCPVCVLVAAVGQGVVRGCPLVLLAAGVVGVSAGVVVVAHWSLGSSADTHAAAENVHKVTHETCAGVGFDSSLCSVN